MPNLTFVLPHWLYWLTLAVVPLLIMLILHLNRHKPASSEATKPIAYFLLLTGGFIGIHRLYLRNLWGLLYIPLFIAILFSNLEGRTARNQVSLASNNQVSAEFLLERAQTRFDAGEADAVMELNQAREELAQAQRDLAGAEQEQQRWLNWSGGLALFILGWMLIDAALIPNMHRRCQALDEKTRLHAGGSGISCDEDLETAGTQPKAATTDLPMVRWIDHLNEFTGHFVAYWSVIAVFAYYYEVLARYVFNSPTNWAHEGMFLMFGMQYLLAGGYVLKNNGHVRVDVFYTRFSARQKAWVDIVTSVFFFIFAGTLLWTGWTFFADSYRVSEVSFTEWGIQYWPVKFALPLGAALILLQGFAWLLKDIALVLNRKA